jgi:hypothetical protein
MLPSFLPNNSKPPTHCKKRGAGYQFGQRSSEPLNINEAWGTTRHQGAKRYLGGQ